jgi:hypothetical protein
VRALTVLIACLLGFVALLGWQIYTILQAEHPELRAAEAFALAVATLIVVFAFTYLSIGHGRPASFSQPLNHIGAMYFTITVISTVGFGNITARTDIARVVVMLQIILDVALLFGIARTVVFAARLGVTRQRAERNSGAGDGEITPPR